MRIVSLLPAATEMIFLLGLEKSLVGISKDSDFPEEVQKIPKLTHSIISNDLTSREINEKVRYYEHKGQSVFHINRNLLKKLNPSLVLTQELCPVCAPSFTDARKACKILKTSYSLVSLEPHTVNDIFENVRTIGEYTNSQNTAKQKIKDLKKRINNIKIKIRTAKRPSVLIIEWLDPLMVSGHWVPQMVELAGGRSLISKVGGKSKRAFWSDVPFNNPDILIIAPCGFGIKRTKKEINLITKRSGFKNLKAYKNKNIYLVDGDSFLTRPGPRVIDGIEIFAEIFHPNIFQRKYPKTAWQNLLFK